MNALRFVLGFSLTVASAHASEVHAQAVESEGRLTLTVTAARALAHFPTVRGARQSVLAARAGRGEARADLFPDVRLQGSATRYEEPVVVHPIHAFGPGDFPPFSRTVFQAGLGLSYLLFEGGRGARIRQADRERAAAEAALAGSEMELLEQVAAKYAEIQSRRAVLDAHEARLVALRAERSRVLKRLEAGKSARVDSLRVESGLAAAEADRVAYEAGLRLSERDLTGLTGIPRDSTRAERLVPVRLVAGTEPDSLIPRALAASPDVLEANERAAAARAGAAAARGARWPMLSASGNYQVWSDPDGNSTGEWNAGVAVSQALFTGGETTSRIRRREALARQAEETVRLSRITTGRAVQAAADRALEAAARRASLAAAAAGYAEVARIEALSLEAGAGTQPDFLRAEADLLEARAALAEAERAEIAARLELARLSGDLTLDWLAVHLEDLP
jgi:outer membrane protein